eukprot:gene12359-14598_t
MAYRASSTATITMASDGGDDQRLLPPALEAMRLLSSKRKLPADGQTTTVEHKG